MLHTLGLLLILTTFVILNLNILASALSTKLLQGEQVILPSGDPDLYPPHLRDR